MPTKGNFLLQCWPRQIHTALQNVFLWRVVCVGNTEQVFVMRNVSLDRSRKHCVGYFPAERCLHVLCANSTPGTPLIKTLCNVVLEAPGNNAQQKVLFNFSFILILLGQHCTSKNLVQCCPRGPRQQFTGESSLQSCFNTPGKILHRKNPVQHSPRGSRQHCTGKNPVHCRLSNIWSLFQRYLLCSD